MPESPTLALCPPREALFQTTTELMLELAKPIRGSDWLIDVATTGAAGFLKFALWAEPGASDNVLGERWTYAQQHTDDLIGRQPPQGKYSREASALAMAAAAYTHASRIAFERGLQGRPIMGVAMTSAVSTSRARRGENACRIAIRTDEGFWIVSVVMDKAQARNQSREARRLEEGMLCDLLTLMAMSSVMGFGTPRLHTDWGVSSPQLVPAESASLAIEPEKTAETPLKGLSAPFYKVLMPDQTQIPISELDPERYILLPGSFNPLHHGHEQIAAMAREQTGKDVIFQITAHHPAKGVIPNEELMRRAAQLQFRWPVVLFDTEGLYALKAERVPGMTMLIGVDVVYGLQDLRYYEGNKAKRRAMFEALARLGTTFLVAGRAVEDHYESLGDVPVPGNFAHLFRPLGGRVDVSSTQLRKSASEV